VISPGDRYLEHVEFPGGEGGYADSAGHPVRGAECGSCARLRGRGELLDGKAPGPDLAQELDQASASLPVGTPVTYWPGYNQHVGRETVTRSEVWRMPAGQLVVKLDGYAGGVALTHITKRFR
jgi:hypothetical protein